MPNFFIYPFALAGDKTTVPNTAQVDGSVSYQEGYSTDYALVYPSDPGSLAIERKKMNQLFYDVTLAIQQYQVNGIPNFITSADNGGSPYPYPIYAQVRFDDGSGPQIFMNLVNGNTNDPTDITSWSVVTLDGVPVGCGINFYGLTVPPGRWLVRNGVAISRTTYSRLFAAIGTTWGVGNGSTTFNLPNSSGCTAAGAGGLAVPPYIGNTVGSRGGEYTHTLSIAEMPNHNHTTFCLSTPINGSGSSGSSVPQTNSLVTSSSVGGNAPHNNMQPTEIILPLIKF